MFPFPLPPGASDPIDIGEGLMIVGFERRTATLVAEVQATLQAAGWACSATGGEALGGMWIIEAWQGNQRWTLTAQGVDDSSQLGISRAED